jgi:hypothetical protein
MTSAACAYQYSQTTRVYVWFGCGAIKPCPHLTAHAPYFACTQGGALEAPAGGETVRRDPGSDKSFKEMDSRGNPSVQQGARDRVLETEYGTAGEQCSSCP